MLPIPIMEVSNSGEPASVKSQSIPHARGSRWRVPASVANASELVLKRCHAVLPDAREPRRTSSGSGAQWYCTAIGPGLAMFCQIANRSSQRAIRIDADKASPGSDIAALGQIRKNALS